MGIVGFGENRVFVGAGEDKERYIHGGGGGKSEVAEVELYRCCHVFESREFRVESLERLSESSIIVRIEKRRKSCNFAYGHVQL